VRAEELVRLERRDLRPVRRGARKRELHIRHGKGARIRSVPIAGPALAAMRRWDRLRTERIGAPPGGPSASARWPLFCTIGRRCPQGGYTALGRECSYEVVAKLVARHGQQADIDPELRHAHVLRHHLRHPVPGRHLRSGRAAAAAGHADVRTTMRYVHIACDELHDRVDATFVREPIALDVDSEAA
jgi:integrase